MMHRRTLLLMGAAVGVIAVAGGGAALMLSDRYRAWIRATLTRALPGYQLEAEGLARFADDYYASKRDYARLRMFAAAERLVDVKWALPAKMAADVEEEERLIVSDFLLGSDFFQTYPDGSKTITYSGRPEACGNPFATF